MEFEPFGGKSEAGDLADISRGFTDHEHLDASEKTNGVRPQYRYLSFKYL